MSFPLAATLAACLSSSAAMADEPDAPAACFTAAEAMLDVAQHPEITATRLNGADATSLLDRVNQVGSVDLHAGTVIVLLYPDHAAVGTFEPCHEEDVAIELAGLFGHLEAVRRTEV